jgi:hypothetical protein
MTEVRPLTPPANPPTSVWRISGTAFSTSDLVSAVAMPASFS